MNPPHLPRSAVALLLAGALLLAPAAPALSATTTAADASPSPTAAGTTWALQPADDAAPDGRVSLRHTIEPGASISDRVALTNFSTRPVTFAVYASDGVITADGNFDLIPNDQEAVDGGTYISFGEVAGATSRDGGGFVLEVPAEATVLIPVQIAVPDNATPGDHPAGIVAELVPGGDSNVQFASRVGVRAHIRVSGDIVPSIVPEGVTATYTPSWNPFAPGTVTVEYTLSNAGNIRLGAAVDTTLAGPFGLASTTTTAEQREILPGAGATATETLQVWPLFFASGDVEAQPAVVGEDVVDVPIPASAATFTVWTIPWSQLILLALLAGVVLLVIWSRKRSKARMQARIDAAVAAATGAAVASTVVGDPADAPQDAGPDAPARDEEPADAPSPRR